MDKYKLKHLMNKHNSRNKLTTYSGFALESCCNAMHFCLPTRIPFDQQPRSASITHEHPTLHWNPLLSLLLTLIPMASVMAVNRFSTRRRHCVLLELAVIAPEADEAPRALLNTSNSGNGAGSRGCCSNVASAGMA